jgi:hypothetical protein
MPHAWPVDHQCSLTDHEPAACCPARLPAAERLHSEQAATTEAGPEVRDLVARLFRTYEERSLSEQRRLVLDL